MKLTDFSRKFMAVLALAALGIAALSLAQTPDPSPLVGKPAPKFRAKLVSGGKFDLAAQRGKHVVLLDFWASWCVPCRRAMPVLLEVAKEYKDRGVLYYAVNFKEDRGTIRRFLKESKLDLQVPLDQEGDIADKYGVEGIPTVVLVDKNGIVRLVHTDYTDDLKTELEHALNEVLHDKTAALPSRATP